MNIYFDSASTTCVRSSVIENMTKCLQDMYGNPSSIHQRGQAAKATIESARKTIAKRLHARPSEIIFTGGTEANNMILHCCVRDLGVKRIITSKIEHHAVLAPCEILEKTMGVEVSFVNLLPDASIDLDHLEKLLKADSTKTLVSLMHVNNEIGNITDVNKVSEICKRHYALFHSDTVQSVGHLDWNLQTTPVDFITASAHKFHGPKGVGFAFIKKETLLNPFILGGAQERGLRAGTEAIHNIVGLEVAFSKAYNSLTQESQHIVDVKNYFINQLKEHFPETSLNGACGDTEKSTYTLINVCFPKVPEDKKDLFAFHLNIKGIACSKGSACQSGAEGHSHVLKNILSEDKLKLPSLRFSFSKYNTREEVDYTINALKDFVD